MYPCEAFKKHTDFENILKLKNFCDKKIVVTTSVYECQSSLRESTPANPRPICWFTFKHPQFQFYEHIVEKLKFVLFFIILIVLRN